jgi:hypothetical protein
MDYDRRKNDDNFLRIIEQQGEIKSLLSSSNTRIEELTKVIAGHSMAISEIRWALWGGPKESDVGLLEKHRKLARNWTIAVSLCAFLFSALGKIVSPLYEKAVASWAYNSVSERWLRQQQRPKVRVYKVIRKKEPEPEDNGE